jgi:class 3 adenylate cyclase
MLEVGAIPARGPAAVREEQESFDRVLATVLFTDIVDSTAAAAVLGDTKWRRLIDEHDRSAKALVVRFRGEYVHTTGDGLLATFDGPARAVRCAQAIIEGARPLGADIRAGLHTGEIERADHGVAGVGVHIGARVGAMAWAGDVWVSSTVKEPHRRLRPRVRGPRRARAQERARPLAPVPGGGGMNGE